MTTTKTGAFDAMLAHHAALADGVARRAAALRARAAAGGGGFEASSAELVAYLAGEVLPHASAEEATIYREAARRPELADTVHQMVREHESLASLVERLAKATDAEAAVTEAEAIQELFVDHVTKENERVLPPLATDATADLEGLLREMHRLTEQPDAAVPGRADTTSDTEGELVRIVLAATTELVDAGKGDRACRLAAAAWAMVRASRPDLAVRLTAALHRLARSITSEPVTLTAGPRSGASPFDAELDVRALAPAQRHEKIFATYNVLGPGTGFVLVNDHDPKPLRYQFEAQHQGRYTWDYLESGPQVWRVRIGRPE